ncbi:hypothetical protein [Nitrosophilus kaiyonis]|uniref:hypothetical protein n=1 Tax=Nitrosophilus kaiyonis TaxID=2930200 RepID=UPI002491B9EF|nr:hypothetical protein [Nitrosophilus kaiyonis]
MRKAATMIELIITIIVLGLAMTTIPVILSSVSKSDEFSLNQEALLAGATTIGNILTYNWDEKSTDLNITLSPILDVTNGDDELDRETNTTWRKGSFKGTNRRKFYNTILYASTVLGNDTNDSDDIDDFIGTKSLTIVSNSNYDYVKDIDLVTNVYYVNDKTAYNQKNLNFTFDINSAGASTNIKLIEVKVIDKLNNNIIAVFRSYALNIGEYKLLSRDF